MADRETWAKRVEAWRASGLTAVQYSAGRGYAPGTLRWWASRLDRQGLVRVVRAEAVPVEADAPPWTEVEVVVGGARMQLRFALEREQLASVLSVLGTVVAAAVRTGKLE